MIVACLKWVDQRFTGVSAADEAALEWALRQRESSRSPDGADDDEVVAITVGPAGSEVVLRDALAVGADRAVRVDLPFGAPSPAVAAAIAAITADAHAIWCGDYSLDRGTGSVPAFLAGELGVVQALGLVDITLATSAGQPIGALRRLDGGRRERLSIDGRAVMSVEGSTARLRRAPLRRLLAPAPIEVVRGAASARAVVPAADARPYRPRPRTYASPVGATALERIKLLTSAGAAPTTHGDTVTLDPPAAAERILAALADWGYLA